MNKLDVQPKGQCYDGRMIRVAMLWLVAEDGEVLLARRADHKKSDPGLWGPSVTGKVELGETFEQAVVREAEEELGLSPDAYTPTFTLKADFVHPDGETRRFKIYVARVPHAIISELRLATDEVAEVKWLSVKEVKQLLKTKPGEVVVASAFVLWEQIFRAIDTHL